MSAPDEQQEDRFAELLAEFEEQLASGTRSTDWDTAAVSSDAELSAEWDGAKECLELLARVRRHWNPLAAAETPLPDAAASPDTLGAGPSRLQTDLLQRYWSYRSPESATIHVDGALAEVEASTPP